MADVQRGVDLGIHEAAGVPSHHLSGGVATAASSVTPAVLTAQSPQAFTLAVPLQVEIMTNVAIR